MAGITNDKLLDVLNEMKVDIAEIKVIVPIVEKLNNDAYIGNGQRPWKQTCREYEDNCKDKKDFRGKVILQVIGAFIAFGFGQFALMLAFWNFIPKLLGK